MMSAQIWLHSKIGNSSRITELANISFSIEISNGIMFESIS